jgi:glycosyltransferase involved in cell wall biosynthesis
MFRISIIVPITRIYGQLHHLERWVREVDTRNIEVILVHDEQDEFSGQELKKMLSMYPEIILLEGRFGSAGVTRNHGLAASSGRYVIFWDCDDDPDVKVLNRMVNSPEFGSCEVYVFQFEIHGQPHRQSNLTDNWTELTMAPGIWRILFSRSIIGNILFSDLSMGEDQVFLAELKPWKYQTYFSKEIIYSYNTGGAGQATSNPKLISTLHKSLIQVWYLFQSANVIDRVYLSNLFWKQFLTAITRGDLRCKKKASTLAFKMLFPGSPKALIQNLRNLLNFMISLRNFRGKGFNA